MLKPFRENSWTLAGLDIMESVHFSKVQVFLISTSSHARRLAARIFAVSLSTVFAATASGAEPGVSDTRVLIGQSAGLTGPVAGSVKEQIAGAAAYFTYINRNGGVNGRKIELLSRDDGFDAKRTPDVVMKLVNDDKVFALFMVRGTPQNESILPFIAKEGVPLIAPSTGAATMHRPVKPMVFNVRAPYQAEVARAINQLVVTGNTALGMFHAEDGFGRDAVEGFNAAMLARDLKPALVRSFKRPMGDISASVAAFKSASPQAVFVIGSGSEAVRFIKEMKKAGGTSQFITLSNNAAKSFVDELGDDGRGVIITQIAPNSSSGGMSIVTEYRRISRETGVEATDAGMEGFMAAKVCVEGLRRAGNPLTRAKFVSALESLRNYDLGGITITYGPDSHSGSSFVELSIISSSGKVLR